MRNRILVSGAALGAALTVLLSAAQDPSATVTPTPDPLSPSPTPLQGPPGATATPDALGSTPSAITPGISIPSPTPHREDEQSAVTSSSSFQWSENGAPVFTLEKAVLTALQQNPDLLRALQEIERAKGVVIQVRAQALPQVNATGELNWTDPNLRSSSSSFTGTGVGGTPAPTPPVAESRVV